MSPERVRVRLRPKFAPLYPELTTEVWLSAREVAEVMVARASQARRQSLHRRTWDPRHFEFRPGPLGRSARRPSLRLAPPRLSASSTDSASPTCASLRW